MPLRLLVLIVGVVVVAFAGGCYTECTDNADCAAGEACRFSADGDEGLCAPLARVENPDGEGEGEEGEGDVGEGEGEGEGEEGEGDGEGEGEGEGDPVVATVEFRVQGSAIDGDSRVVRATDAAFAIDAVGKTAGGTVVPDACTSVDVSVATGDVRFANATGARVSVTPPTINDVDNTINATCGLVSGSLVLKPLVVAAASGTVQNPGVSVGIDVIATASDGAECSIFLGEVSQGAEVVLDETTDVQVRCNRDGVEATALTTTVFIKGAIESAELTLVGSSLGLHVEGTSLETCSLTNATNSDAVTNAPIGDLVFPPQAAGSDIVWSLVCNGRFPSNLTAAANQTAVFGFQPKVHTGDVLGGAALSDAGFTTIDAVVGNVLLQDNLSVPSSNIDIGHEALTIVIGDLKVDNATNVTGGSFHLRFPALVAITGVLEVRQSDDFVDFKTVAEGDSFPSLISVGSLNIEGNPNLTSVSLPKLDTTTSVNVRGNVLLTDLDLHLICQTVQFTVGGLGLDKNVKLANVQLCSAGFAANVLTISNNSPDLTCSEILSACSTFDGDTDTVTARNGGASDVACCP